MAFVFFLSGHPFDPAASFPLFLSLERVGLVYRISCPVEGRPAPYIEWSKDGQSLDHTWERYKVSEFISTVQYTNHFYIYFLKGQLNEIFDLQLFIIRTCLGH